ncbi:uncharacterized protein LOC129724776 isoform X2 [Wyeomyia smithii]|uniref:uncharacterized protein LOC129724776 isoform X2 n=1 Tax=Wyeomyia smithii TaxID=174621 RepID=UPI002467EE8B|nr:uncharacterized protein LOC129724776 isoform X2 [Wyeomyia smithii]
MNLRHQETFCIALLLCTLSITFGQDFQFASEKEDEVQPMLAEPLDVVRKAQQSIKSIYSKEKAQCPATQNRLFLSLVLRSHSWDEIVEKKRQKAVNKLSKFFLIPKENFIIDDVSRPEIHQMTKNSIRHGQNSLNGAKRKLGRIGFLIGCGKTIFPSEKLIANTIAQQMKEKALDDISGLDFGWWSIWSKHAEETHQRQKLHLRRLKRQTNGDDYENDDDDYDYNYDDEDEAEPTETPHAHRHHHGDGSPVEHVVTSSEKFSNKKHPSKLAGSAGVRLPQGTEADEHNLIVPSGVLDRTLAAGVGHGHKNNHGRKVDVTQTESNDQFDFTQADIRESVSQLESTITKTIENNEQLKKEEESLLAKKTSKHKPIDIERIVETELMLPDIEQLKGRDVFKDDYVIEDVAIPDTPFTHKVPTTHKKTHISSSTTTNYPLGTSQSDKNSLTSSEVIPATTTTTTLATTRKSTTVTTTIVATTPEVTTHKPTTIDPTNDDNLSNQQWTSTEQFSTTGGTFGKMLSHYSTTVGIIPTTVTPITTTKSTPATTTKSTTVEASSSPQPPARTTTTANIAAIITTPSSKLIASAGPTFDVEEESLASTVAATNTRSTNKNKSAATAIDDTKTDDESAEGLLPTSFGTPPSSTNLVTPTISITSATLGSSPTDAQIIPGTLGGNVATTTAANHDLPLTEDRHVDEPDEEDEEDEYEDTVIITELPNSVAPIVTAPSTTLSSAVTTAIVVIEAEPSSTTVEPTVSSSTSQEPFSPSSSSSQQPPLPPSTTTATTSETATTIPLELVTAPRVVFVETTTSPAPTTTAITTTTTTSSTTTSATSAISDSAATTTTTAIEPKVTTQKTVSKVPAGGGKREPKEDTYEENYDDEYDDELEEETTTSAAPVGRVASSVEPVASITTESTTPEPTTTPTPTTVPSTSSTTTITTEASTVPMTTTTSVPATTTSATVATITELDEPTNLYPIIKNRIPKMAIIAGKVFTLAVPLDTFHDTEDGNNLRLDLYDAHGYPLKNNSWIQFNVETREIYGLPLEKDVSKWHYILQATDSGNQSVNETVDISVQQHKSHRSVNHEISLALRLQRKFPRNVDWQIEVIRGIAKVLGDISLTNIVVREVRNSIQDPNLATFVYTNDTLPKDRCPEEKLDELVAQLTEKALNDALNPDILVKSVQGQQIGQCLKPLIPKVKPTQSIATKNFAPTTRNQVDRVNATVGHLLVYKVPADTFYDPEDGNDLKLKLLTTERNQLDQYHWLQFDSKNHEFFGIPRSHDVGQKEYLLMAEDREGLTATDALVVVVHQAHYKRDYSVLFELTLDTTYEQFNIAQAQRRFIERLAQVFGDSNTNYIQIRNIRPIQHTGQVQVTFFNTTLYRQHQRCPDEEIEALRNILLYPDGTIRAKVREILGQEFSLQNVSLIPVGTCQGYDTPIHATNEPEKALPPPIAKDDYLLTFVLPAVIILAMLLIASIIACVLYRRRLTGKMELGTDEERKSFRSKGIPVIFQDELDEKPEIGNKSPVILKDEKPPLLPPSYSSTNNDGENEDVDEYVPPPAVVVGGRESRGKSPVTPSYRRPPPYVSP